MRLFVAIDVPHFVKEHLSSLQQLLDVAGLKLVSTKNIHLTLNFLGEQVDIGSIVGKLRDVSFSPFTLRLSSAGFFPDIISPQVLWIGIAQNAVLSSLQSQIDMFFKPKRSFKPHLTLARIKNLDENERLNLTGKVESLPMKKLSFKVDEFRLYKSTLTQIGPIYEVVETFRA